MIEPELTGATPVIVSSTSVQGYAKSQTVTPQPDANGGFNTPAEGAKFMASFGIPQTPLNGKKPFLSAWQDNGSADFARIDEWAARYAGCNFGSIAKASEDGHYVLEADSVEVRKTFKKETNSDFTAGLIIQSGEGRDHRWYKHNDESRALSNIGQTDAAGFSLRLNNEQCVSPGSIHPERKTQYIVIRGNAPTVASPAEISWLRTKKVQAQQSKKAEIKDGKRVLIRHGAMYHALISQAGKLWNQGFNPTDIPDMLVAWAYENCEQPIDERKVKSYAEGSNWTQGEPGAEWVYSGAYEETITEIEEELPPFPRLSGLLTELSDAICPDLPYEFKVMAAITHWGLIRSGLDTLEGETFLQPRFYTCFIKEPGYGKSAALNEIRTYAKMWGANYSTPSSVDSGPALVDEFSEVRAVEMMRNNYEGDQIIPSRVLLDTDEITDLFEKSKVTTQGRNSLFTELLKLYETNRTGNRSRKNGKSQLDCAHLAMIAGATPGGYSRMWTGTGGGSTGLQSRMILISTAQPKMGIDKKTSDTDELARILPLLNQIAAAPPIYVLMDGTARSMLNSWWGRSERDKPSESRVDDMVKRLLIVLAVTSGQHTVDKEMMGEAIQWGEYIIAAREKYNEPDSYTWIQAFEDAIRKAGARHTSPMTLTDYRRLVQPNRKPGGVGPFLNAWRNLIAVEELKPNGKTQKGTIKYQF